jgi:hypothetical protein
MRNSAKLPFRLAAGIFFLFAVGHTAGFLRFKPVSEAGQSVLDQMMRVSFDFGGTQATWWGLYKGFGLSISASLLFFAIVVWRFSNSVTDPSLAKTFAWLLCLTQLVNMAVCLAYFGPVQAAFTAASAACLAWGALAVSKPIES